MRAPRHMLRCAVGLALMCSTASARGQGTPSPAATASAAFAQGQALQVAGDHAGAAEAFELADRTLPAAAALRAAIVNRMAAGQNARAATLALRAQERYPDDAETRELARTTIAELSPRLTRVAVHCSEPCSVSVSNQVVVAAPALDATFFVVPGAQNLEVAFDADRKLAHRIETHEGEAIERAFEPPLLTPAPPSPEPAPVAVPAAAAPAGALATLAPASATTPPTAPTTASASRSDDTASAERPGLSPVVFWVGAGLTAAAGGVTLWSGLDALSGVDAYERAPTKAKYEDGRDREVRTNVALGATSALAVGTAVLGLFFTDWSDDDAPRASVSVGQDGVSSHLSVAF